MNPRHSGTLPPLPFTSLYSPSIMAFTPSSPISLSFPVISSVCYITYFFGAKAMFLRSVSAFSLPTSRGDCLISPIKGFSASSSSRLRLRSSSSGLSFAGRKPRSGLRVSASSETENLQLTGVVFQPFEEIKKVDLDIPIAPQLSLARQRFSDECEAAINEQINVEYNVSYVYHSLYAYFDRDNIALKGLAKFFKESSEEEREHAEKLMEYQNIRGGRVKLHSIVMPPSDFEHAEKGDALYAMELALSLEKLTNEKLLSQHNVAERNNDAQMMDFIESEFLSEQVETIKKISEYVAQLRMVGKGHGVWHFDQMLLHNGDAA